ncbi:MAG TPA: hypothetical protein DIV79_15295 [Opitutae bacterium]|nr:hypothetical protein [Opitutaceae bacterium]HCR31370.1 hypothetical protein [Opitutae bacterium]|tara:strand:+ start:1264 stop:1497 length:234 start_codon:yes stop_codon:yes gene_type:complete
MGELDTLIITMMLLLSLCSCSREAAKVEQKPVFLATGAETVIAVKPEASEEAALKHLQDPKRAYCLGSPLGSSFSSL